MIFIQRGHDVILGDHHDHVIKIKILTYLIVYVLSRKPKKNSMAYIGLNYNIKNIIMIGTTTIINKYYHFHQHFRRHNHRVIIIIHSIFIITPSFLFLLLYNHYHTIVWTLILRIILWVLYASWLSCIISSSMKRQMHNCILLAGVLVAAGSKVNYRIYLLINNTYSISIMPKGCFY